MTTHLDRRASQKRVPDLQHDLKQLQAALCSVHHSGSEGFEGLLAVVLTKITGFDFRLARSGSQYGKDGANDSSSLSVAFEGKRYSNKIDDNDILSKIMQLNTQTDIWVLGATVEISTQTIEVLRRGASKFGVEVLILDWNLSSPIPPLALACAAAPDEVILFLETHSKDKSLIINLRQALARISKAEGNELRFEALVKDLTTPALSLATATDANNSRLVRAFSDRNTARGLFGQALAPAAVGTAFKTRARTDLHIKLQACMRKITGKKLHAVLGGEGFGKTWAIAQSWMALEELPLLLLLPANGLNLNEISGGNTRNWLIRQFILGSGDYPTHDLALRWERRLSSWSPVAVGETPRFILCVDGLNQLPSPNWARALDGLVELTYELGGTVLVTCRQLYFDQFVSKSLSSEFALIQVPEWSDTELDQILAEQKALASGLSSATRVFLRNPRLLSIACELKATNKVSSFAELTVERLLFEHIKATENEGAAPEETVKFVKRLAEHATAITERIIKHEIDDRLIFEFADGHRFQLSSELAAVISEKFYQPRDEDATLYELNQEGLTLALGLSIIKALQKAERNQANLDEELERLIEPIAALDLTAQAVFSATLIASLDETCSEPIKCALISSFLRLQNVEENLYPAFLAIVRSATQAAVAALDALAILPQRYTPYKNWLIEALRDCRQIAECWSIISPAIAGWLRTYSMDPAISVFRGHDGANSEEYKNKLIAREAVLKEKFAALSVPESEFLSKHLTHRLGVDPSELHENGIRLVAGMPLAEFVDPLIAGAFSTTLNSSVTSSVFEFTTLLRYNSVDWKEMREAALESLSVHFPEGASAAGKWALASVLRGAGNVNDGSRAEAIAEELTKDREAFKSWRLVENYCASDPCDPQAELPENIAQTAEKYSRLGADKFAEGLSATEQSHFVDSALPGMARFNANVAAGFWQKAATSLVIHPRSIGYLGFAQLEAQSSALNHENIEQILEFIRAICSNKTSSPEEKRDAWQTCWYAIEVCFPHMSGQAQFEFLMSLPHCGKPIHDFGNVQKPASAKGLQTALESQISKANEDIHVLALSYAGARGAELTTNSLQRLLEFAIHENDAIRGLSLRAIFNSSDPQLIKEFFESDWSAQKLDLRANYYEIWYGSRLLIEASKNLAIDPASLITRISPKLYGFASTETGLRLAPVISHLLLASFKSCVDFIVPFLPPEIEEDDIAGDDPMPILRSLANLNKAVSHEEVFRSLSETPDEFASRQETAWASFEEFEALVKGDGASLITENVGFEAINIMVENRLSDAVNCAKILLNLDDNYRYYSILNFGLHLSRALSKHEPKLAGELFSKLANRRGIVSIVVGTASYSLESKSIWESADSRGLDKLRSLRLDLAPDDHTLSQEVVAAILAGKQLFLEQYVSERIGRAEPAQIGRALMVIGFGEPSEYAIEIIEKHKDAGGFVGQAAKASRYAYDRNVWAQHWHEIMCRATSKTEFWATSVLLLKIVDGRIDVWCDNITRPTTIYDDFWPTISDRISNRVKKWKSKREKTLFGGKVPHKILMT